MKNIGREQKVRKNSGNNKVSCLITQMPEKVFSLLASEFHGKIAISPKKIAETLNNVDRRGHTFKGSRWFGNRIELQVHGLGKQTYEKEVFLDKIDKRNVKSPAERAFATAN